MNLTDMIGVTGIVVLAPHLKRGFAQALAILCMLANIAITLWRHFA